VGRIDNGSEGEAMNIEIITREGCAFCVRGKKVLQEAGFPFTETEIGKDITRDDVLKKYPDAKLLPLFILDGKFMGSYDELYDWVTGELDKKETQTMEGLTKILLDTNS
jgi:glutaredoxin